MTAVTTLELTPEELDEIERERINKRNETVVKNLPLAYKAASRYSPSSFHSQRRRDDDLVQIASETLIRAVERHDPSRGTLGTYFFRCVQNRFLGEIKRPRNKQRFAERGGHDVRDQSNWLSHQPGPEEIASLKEELEEARKNLSLFRAVFLGLWCRNIFRIRDRMIFFLRCGFKTDFSQPTLEVVAERCGLTRERVRQIVSGVWKVIEKDLGLEPKSGEIWLEKSVICNKVISEILETE